MRSARKNVLGVMMPSCYSRRGGAEDSIELAQKLGIHTLTLAISDIMTYYDRALQEALRGDPPDVTEEQPRPS
jgi:NAD+ synthase (glutamine-hydrolysing)